MRILEFDYGFDKRTDSICFLWSLDNNSQLHNLLLIRRSFWNRIWVFESKDDNIIKEILLFYGGRVFSGAIDTAMCIHQYLMNSELFAKIWSKLGLQF